MDWLGDLFEAGADLIGGAAKGIGGLLGGGGSSFALGNIFGGPGQGGMIGLGAQIFGGTDDDPWGVLDSPVFGHVAGAVGAELLKPTAKDRIEEQRGIIRAQEEERARQIRRNYGLDPNPAPRAY